MPEDVKFTRLNVFLRTLATISVLAAATVAVPCAAQTAPASSPPLSVVGNVQVLTTAQARGVQIYVCTANPANGAGATAYSWVFKGPEADLFDSAGKKIGRHYAGPTWESVDGSKVVGKVIDSVKSPGNVPWLLLAAKSNTGSGVFGSVTYIERVLTEGGLAPSTGADAAHVGQEIRVPYTATYVFYGAAS